jgi:hypothetical protein
VRLLDNYTAAVLSNPSLNSIGLLSYLEDAGAIFVCARATEASLTPICEVDALVFSPIVIVVVVTASHPLNCLLLE